MGEYMKGLSVVHQYTIIPAIDSGNLLIFDNTGLCSEAITLNLPNGYQLLNDDNIPNTPMILNTYIISYSRIIDNNNRERLIHFEKLENGPYLINDR